MNFSVYADGSSGGGSHAPIGWGWIIVERGLVIAAGNGGAPEGTNNQAELLAAINGLEALYNLDACHCYENPTIELVSDSQYTLGLADGSFSPTLNQDLAEQIRVLCERMKVKCRWVRGHDGHPIQEMCDKMAKHGKAKFQPPKEKKNERKKRRKKLVAP